MLRVLVVDDELSIRETLRELLADDGYDASCAESAMVALEHHREHPFDIVITDLIMPEVDGITLMQQLLEASPETKVILITAEPTYETAAAALRGGAFDYIPKPVNERLLHRVVSRAAQLHLLEADNRRYREQLEELVARRTRQIAIHNERLRQVAEQARTLVRCESPEDLAERVLRMLAQVLGAQGGSFYRLSGQADGTGRLELCAALDPGHQAEIIDLPPPDRSVLGRVLEERWSPCVRDIRSEPLRPSGWSGYHDGSLLVLPCLDAQDEILGVMVLHNKREPPFDESDLEIGRIIAAHVTESLLALRSAQEKAELERQLIQAQKMDAIGRLAGGIAHDFNNLLTGITGFAELALLRTSPGSPTHDFLTEIRKATSRASALTGQLLAFSRRQPASPQVVSLSETIDSSRRMLARIIGEPIKLEFQPGDHRWTVRIDPLQIDQILVNLATNARDAMPDGGRLLIRTRCVVVGDDLPRSPDALRGEFVVLSVADSGHGMDDETLEHIFEPFFTTKAHGKGTGLGLSTVYGIARQNGGFVDVHTRLGAGTTVEIYLPRAGEPTAELRAPGAPAEPAAGHETVLLVEDDDIVRDLVRRALELQGYTVLDAADPQLALEHARRHREAIKLLIIDVVLPLMTGLELEAEARALIPAARTIFISGYPDETLAKHGVLSSSSNFLPKPFDLSTLTKVIRSTLDRQG